MRLRSRTLVSSILAVCLFGCVDLGSDRSAVEAMKQDLSRLKGTCDRLTKELNDLKKVTAELSQEVAKMREAETARSATPPSRPDRTLLRETENPREREPVRDVVPAKDAALCEIVETHIAAVEGILSQPVTDSVDAFVDDLQAVFEANLKKFSRDPRIDQLRQAAATMRTNYLAAAKQGHLAMNPYLKNVRQKSLNDARQAARTLRLLCEE
jgi:hypothetical protein